MNDEPPHRPSERSSLQPAAFTEAMARISSRAERPGMTLLVGAPGTGKTAFAHLLNDAWKPRRSVMVSAYRADALDGVLRQVRNELTVTEPGDLVIIDALDELATPTKARDLRRLASEKWLARAHVLVTMREFMAATLAAGDSSSASFPPQWSATGEPADLVYLGADPTSVRSLLARTTDEERGVILKRLLGSDSPAATLAELRVLLASPIGPDLFGRPDLIITPTHGRLRVSIGTALSSGPIKFGSNTVDGTPWVLFKKNRGIWLPAADALEELVNDPGTSENDLQAFFEQNPHILTRDSYVRAIPHPVLASSDGDLIPDFMLEPEMGFADIVELKLPTAKLTAGKTNRLRPSADLSSALAQVREYASHFEDPAARSTFKQIYGVDAYLPTTALVIGRDPVNADPLELRRLWAEVPRDVEVQTYDELVRRIRRLGSF